MLLKAFFPVYVLLAPVRGKVLSWWTFGLLQCYHPCVFIQNNIQISTYLQNE